MKIISAGYRTDLMLLAWSGSQIIDRDDHLVIRTAANPDYWWGNFLLLRDPIRPGQSEHWLQVFSAEFGDASHVAIGIDGVDGQAGEIADLLSQKITCSSNAVLVADHLRPASRSGAEVRQLQTAADWQQAYELRLACSDLDDTEANRLFLRRRLASDRSLTEAGHGAWFGAFVDGRLRSSAGIFSNGTEARYQVVQTDPGFRRRGLAAEVINTAGTWALSTRAAERLVIVADPDYHAINLYRSLGFVDAERQTSLERAPSPGN